MGVKLGSYPVEEQKRNRAIELQKELREMAERRRGIARERSRGGMTDEEFERQMQKERERVRNAVDEFNEPR